MKCRINACYCLPPPPSRPKLDKRGFGEMTHHLLLCIVNILQYSMGTVRGFVTWWGPSLLLAWVTHSDCFLTLLCSWSTSLLVLGNPDACLCYTVEISGGGEKLMGLPACGLQDPRRVSHFIVLYKHLSPSLSSPRLIDQYKYKPGLSMGHFSVSRSNCKIHLQGLP